MPFSLNRIQNQGFGLVDKMGVSGFSAAGLWNGEAG